MMPCFFPKEYLKNFFSDTVPNGWLFVLLVMEVHEGIAAICVGQIGSYLSLSGSSHPRIGWNQAREPDGLVPGFFSAPLCS